jgi:glucosamine--fructose-6-phosphate aminotransferase (isomerizing)
LVSDSFDDIIHTVITAMHNMLKEIYEQPEAVSNTISSLQVQLETSLPLDMLCSASRFVIAASGTSRHAGIAGKAMLEELAGIPTDVEYATEFQFTRAALDEVLTIVVTQSGETADTLAALRRAKANGSRVLAICNVAGSSVMREADAGIHTKAGVEVAIPSTKAFTAQLAAFDVLSVALAAKRGSITQQDAERLVNARQSMPEKIRSAIALDNQCRRLAEQFSSFSDFIFAGRGVHAAAALDGALKLKEVAYLHAEGLPTGEIPHGPLALMDENVAVFVLATYDDACPESKVRYEASLTNTRQIRQRGAKVIAVGIEGDEQLAELSHAFLPVPQTSEQLLPILEIVPLQLFAYHSAVLKGLDVDRPRYLTKAVLTQ